MNSQKILGPITPEIVGLKIIETTWISISLLCERAYQITTVYVFSDSVLCVGEMEDDPNAAWKKKMKVFAEQGIESHRWHGDRGRVQNIPRIHYVGHPREDYTV